MNIESVSLVSPEGAQSSSSEDPPCKEKTILRHCDQRVNNMEDTICAERESTRGME
jgi:hypothetical protein